MPVGGALSPASDYPSAPQYARTTVASTDKLLLRNRALIESGNDQLKNICQIDHSRHRSQFYFLVHHFAGLTLYCHKPKKSTLPLSRDLLVARLILS